jgi:hypothetical protein
MNRFKNSFWGWVYGQIVWKICGKEPRNFLIINGKKCKVDRAPEPTDIIWENMSTKKYEQ